MGSGLKTFLYAVVAGLCIAVGGTVFLSIENKIIGALFFTAALFTICTFGLNLCTGKVCYLFENDRKYALNVLIIWLGNLVGTWASSMLIGPGLPGLPKKRQLYAKSSSMTVWSAFLFWPFSATS